MAAAGALLCTACGAPAPGSPGWIQTQVDEARARLMASEGGRRALDEIEERFAWDGADAWISPGRGTGS